MWIMQTPISWIMIFSPIHPLAPSKKENKEIRKILRNMLNTGGYERAGNARKLGVGQAPAGWPSHIKQLSEFDGSTRSGQVTEIIKSLLTVSTFAMTSKVN